MGTFCFFRAKCTFCFSRSGWKKQNVPISQRGFVLLSVIVAITLLAAIAYVLGYQGASQTGIAVGELQRDQLRYIAEAGIAHAISKLTPSDTCDSYAGVASTNFGVGIYAATVSPADASPVTVMATGTIPSGAEIALRKDVVRVYDASTTQTLTLQPGPEGEDAEIWDQEPNNNYGDANETWVSSASDDTTRSLLRFKMGAIPAGARIGGATLSLYRRSGSGADQPVSAHRIMNSWSEGSVTWNLRKTGTNWDTAGSDFDNTAVAMTPVGPANVRYEWDITRLVQGWVDGSYPNYGVALAAAIAGMPGERFYTSDESDPDRRPSLSITYTCECGQTCAAEAGPELIVLSTDSDADLGGLSFQDTDLVEYDGATDTATLYLDSIAAGLAKKIDALHVLENGHLILSTQADTTFGGLTFKSEDLVEYDPIAGTATMYLEADVHFQSKNDIISVHILDNGNTVLSVNGNATLGGMPFSDKDLVEYNRFTGEASIFFDGDATTLSKRISALHVLPDGHFVLAPDGDTTLGGLSFGPDQLVDYDPAANVAVLYFDGESLFSETSEKVRSVHIGPGSGSIVPTAGTPNLLFVVGQSGGAGPTAEELAHRSLIESWGYSVELIDDGASQAEFDTAAANNDVVFITNDIDASTLGTKLANTTTGVVTSEDNLSDEFGLSSSIAWGSGDSITVTDNAHYITLPFATGDRTILSTSESLAYLTGMLSPELGLLATAAGGSAVVTLEAGAMTYTGGTVAGRRAQLPWGGNGFDPNNLNAAGLTILRRALEWGAGAVVAPEVHLSTDSDASLGGLSFQDTDVARYQSTTDLADLFLDSVLAGLEKKVDALHVLANGHLILSTQADATFGGLTFKSEDLIEYDPIAGAATMYLEADAHFDSKKDIISVHVLDNGNVVVSTNGNAVLGGLAFSERDLVEYDRSTGTASIFFDGDATTLSKRISAVHILPNGNIILAPEGDTTLGGLSFGPDQLVEYNPSSNLAFLYFDGESLFSETSEKVRSVHIGAGSGGAGGGGGGGGSCNGTFRDEFKARTFSGSDGTSAWAGNWLEVGESDGPTSGDTLVANDQSNYQLRTRDNNNGGEGVEREADLSGAGSATLTYDYRRESLDSESDYTSVEISANGAVGPWTELTRHSGGNNNADPDYVSTSHNVSSFISATTRIRFKTSPSMGGSDIVWFDNVQIACTP